MEKAVTISATVLRTTKNSQVIVAYLNPNKHDLPDYVLKKANLTKKYLMFLCIANNSCELPQIEKMSFEVIGSWAKEDNGVLPKFYCNVCRVKIPPTKSALKSFLKANHIDVKVVDNYARNINNGDIGQLFRQISEKLMINIEASTLDYAKITSNLSLDSSRSRLISLLAKYNFAQSTMEKLYSIDNDIVDKITTNPFIILNYTDVSFAKIDQMARDLGTGLKSQERVEGAIIYALKQNEFKGNMYCPYNELSKEVLKILNNQCDSKIDEELIKSALVHAHKESESIVIRNRNNAVCIYRKQADYAEYHTAKKLVELLKSNKIGDDIKEIIKNKVNEYCQNANPSPSANQAMAVINSLCNRVSIITGGPGTGKSTITKAIIKVYEDVFGGQITLLAPTGKASRRMTQATGYQSSTIHSKLGIYDTEIGAKKELSNGLIIVDEASMIDQYLMENLMDAIDSNEVHLIFVGDICQLPSVGAGDVLAQLIQSKVVPTSVLTEIFRQKGGSTIIDNAYKINSGQCTLHLDSNFEFYEVSDELMAAGIIKELYKREAEKVGIDNISLLCPLRNSKDGKYLCSSESLNQLIQMEINPSQGFQEIKVGSQNFRIGDRIMQWRNTKDSSNGDIGVIKDIHTVDFATKILIDWENGNQSTYTYDDMKSISLAYAISIHKSQGSEYNSVIIPLLSKEKCPLFKRNLFYTGVTRAKKRVIIVGDKGALHECVSSCDLNIRKTLLSERLNHQFNRAI